jgi:putative intracellular protease/amidase/YHS domain-containing protein
MNRRTWLKRTAALGFVAAVPAAVARRVAFASGSKSPSPLTPPAEGSIPVAFLVSDGAVIIDFCGPWEVFQDVVLPGRKDPPFKLYTVSETTKPIEASGGMKIVPDYALATAPPPKVIVIPAQANQSEPVLQWIRTASKSADVTMSVCTGAFVLAKTGLLNGKTATTNHNMYTDLAMGFPDVRVRRGARFVEDGNVSSAGGLSSGIDLALRVVERYYGRQVAEKTAYEMEYQGQGWLNPDGNEIYTRAHVSTDAHPLCPVCFMDVDPKSPLKTVYQGKTYFFCGKGHMALFQSAPDKVLQAGK